MPKTLAEQAKARDNNTCQKCGRNLSKSRLEAHHIHPQWAGGEDSLENLVTLCKICHSFAPELRLEAAAHDVTEAYLARTIPPALELFLFGAEWANLSDSDMDRLDGGRRQIISALAEVRDSDDQRLPMEPKSWYEILFQIVEHERVLNDPDRVESDRLKERLEPNQ